MQRSFTRKQTRTKAFTMWTKAEQQLQRLGGCRRRMSDALGQVAVSQFGDAEAACGRGRGAG